MPKFAEDAIPDVSIDEALPSGPLRRSRRRAQKEKRDAPTGGKKEGDKTSRRAARVSKPVVRLHTGSDSMTKGFRVIVSGLLPSTTEAQVRELFRVVPGKILKCTLGRQQGTNKPVGVAEVVYGTSAHADKAAQVLNKATVDGRVIAVQSRGLAFFSKTPKVAKTAKKGRGAKKAGQKKEKKAPLTSESLNQELEKYMA